MAGKAEKAPAKAEQQASQPKKAAACPDCGREIAAGDGMVTVCSKSRAGKRILARTGSVIELDGEGKARVSPEDAAYLAKCPGFSVEEA